MNRMTLQKEIYPKSAIEETIQAFSRIAKIHMEEEKENYYSLTFEQCLADPQRTMDELGKYVLAETIRAAGGMYD